MVENLLRVADHPCLWNILGGLLLFGIFMGGIFVVGVMSGRAAKE